MNNKTIVDQKKEIIDDLIAKGLSREDAEARYRELGRLALGVASGKIGLVDAIRGL